MASNIRKSIATRAAIFILLLIAAMVVITVKALYIKIVYGEEYSRKIAENSESEVPIAAVRGDILAVDGRKLACSVPNYRICMDPCAGGLSDEVFNNEIETLAKQLSSFYGDHSTEYYKKYINDARVKGKRYLQINPKRLSYNELKKVKEFAIFKLGKHKGGFIIEENDTRKLPFGLLAARTIGKLYNDKKKGGMVGLENSYDNELRGEDGISNNIRITGKWIKKEKKAPIDGRSIKTTIDIDIQDVAEHSLMQQLSLRNADHGVAILMEVKTGKIRAIANLHRLADGTYSEDFYNYAIGELAEPGSTFKLATLMACLEDDMIDVNDTIDTFNGEYKFYDRTMRDSKRGGHGKITIQRAFEVSSNVAFSRIVQNCYGNDPQRFIDRLHDLGLCDSLGLEIKGEGKTHIKNVDDATWSGTSLPWMSIGYELQLTPLQLLTFYNAVANGGTMMKPMFVEEIIEHGHTVTRFRPKVLRNSIASRTTIRTVRELLKGVVENGTATNIKNTPYKIAGKTGTAQIAHDSRGYMKDGQKRYLASFAGYFPADDPMYSCIVMVYGPSNNVYYGNIVAGTVVKAIADRVYAAEYRNGNIKVAPIIALTDVYPYSKGGRIRDIKNVFSQLKIPHNLDITSEWTSTTAQENQIKLTERRFVENIVPDVRGMGASDAVSLLESMGLKVKISGYGRVTSQQPAAGTKYFKGTLIQIQLSNNG